MATYHRETRVRAPFEDVWAFHATTDGLEALTPSFLGLSVESVTGPDGEPDPETLVAGSRIELSMRPFRVGPRQRWTSVITHRERDGDSGLFRDEMADGPFTEWEHTHRFAADGDVTVVSDTVEYELPGGAVGRLASPLGTVGFEPMFCYRHRQTRTLLEA